MNSGSIDKDSEYRTRILTAVAGKRDHPIHHGIDMQAHHVISAKGAKNSDFEEELPTWGFNINVLENLVLIPCTLPGACHLGCQLHRGNHSYSDDEHPKTYHAEVTDRINGMEKEFDKKCAQNKSIQGLMNKEAEKILAAVNSFDLPLTKIWRAFNSSSGSTKYRGCSNAASVSAHKANVQCNKDRNHFKGVRRLNYKLKVGQ